MIKITLPETEVVKKAPVKQSEE